MENKWRFIDSGKCGASLNMALDETLALSVKEEKSPPVLRIYSWNMPSVSIGCFQHSKDIDFLFCSQNGIPVVRRPTGGRALLHVDEITYSFSSRTYNGIFKTGLFESYKKISYAFKKAFEKVGIKVEMKSLKDKRDLSAWKGKNSPLCFQSISYAELSMNNKKIIGSAQKRWVDCLLQQGAIPLSFDDILTQKIFKLNDSRNNIDYIALKHLAPEINIEEFKEIIRESFEQTFNIEFIDSKPTQEELSLAIEIENKKYLSEKWTFKR